MFRWAPAFCLQVRCAIDILVGNEVRNGSSAAVMPTHHGQEAATVIVEEREDELRALFQRPFHKVCHPQEKLHQ